MNKITFSIMLIMCVVIAIYLGLKTSSSKNNLHESCTDDHDHETEESIVFSDKAKYLSGIKIAQAHKGAVDKKILLPGEITFNQDKIVRIIPRFSGVVIETKKQIGDHVKKGDEIATIESNESMTSYPVNSPITGQIIDKQISAGEFADNGTVLYIIADVSDVWVNLTVYPNTSRYVRKGQDLHITDLDGNIRTDGTISYISPMLSCDTQTLTARAVLNNHKGTYHPGTYVTGEILIESEESLIVKKDAIQIVDGFKTIFKVNEAGEFVSSDVVCGDIGDEYVQIISGIDEGESYVADGAFSIKAHLVTKNLDPHAGHGH